jgi:DNA polymerase III alpha subunit
MEEEYLISVRIKQVTQKRVFVKRMEVATEVAGVHFEPGDHPIDARVEYKADFPDIDLDFLPEARENIKAYITERYGKDCVCNVGTHISYQPMAALHDAARALGKGLKESEAVTKDLPLEFNSMDEETAKKEFPQIAKFAEQFPDVFHMAYKMDGRIKTQGKHAGGVIISSVPLRDYMPLTMKEGQWSSAWTEGETAQLSRFGFVKFDLLGLTTLSYIHGCLQNIQKNKGVRIEWDIDPEDDRVGWKILRDGTKEKIAYSDPVAMNSANLGKVDTVFQFDTDLAKSIISKGGVTRFEDFAVYTALGRPGPLPMIDSYIKRRDGEEQWDEKNKISQMLAPTFNVPTFQEQLTDIWQGIAGMTGPEAQAALKVVRKKKVDQMAKVRQKWMEGATKTLGKDAAEEWWGRQESFAMYAFNRSHAVAYANISYRCLWLKAHYPTEWWAACLEHAGRDKLPLYMNASRRDGVRFRAYDANDLHATFIVEGEEIIPGLHMIKGFGEKAAQEFEEKRRQRTIEGIGGRVAGVMPTIETLEQFIYYYEPGRTQIEALIKMGAFDSFREGKNRKALWAWWQYKYGSNDEDREMKRKILWSLRWAPEQVAEQRNRMRDSYLGANVKRKKVPDKIVKWVPDAVHLDCQYRFEPKAQIDRESEAYKQCAKIKPSFEDISRLFAEDFSLRERLSMEMEYLGFYWTSPMKQFQVAGHTIENGKTKDPKEIVVIEGIVKRTMMLTTKKGDSYMKILISDGLEEALVNIWGTEFERLNHDLIDSGTGLRIEATWDERFQSFTPVDVSRITGLQIVGS